MRGLKMISTGRCLPRRSVTNKDMSELVETNDEWIFSRTGIRTRRFCGEETAVDLSAGAAQQAMERAGIRPEELGACVVCTITPDYLAPSEACLLQRRLGLPEDIPCFDLNAGCTGFLYGLQVIRGLLLQSPRRYALLVGAEVLSRITDFADRSTCVLFGDGARRGGAHAGGTGSLGQYLGRQGRGRGHPRAGPGQEARPYIKMDGQKVFRFAVEAIPRCIGELLGRTGLELEDIDWFVPHQANRRIIDHVAKKLRLPEGRFYQNMERYGNTSAASIPIALDEMAESGLLLRGQKVMCIGFGAGLTWGGALLEW